MRSLLKLFLFISISSDIFALQCVFYDSALIAEYTEQETNCTGKAARCFIATLKDKTTVHSCFGDGNFMGEVSEFCKGEPSEFIREYGPTSPERRPRTVDSVQMCCDQPKCNAKATKSPYGDTTKHAVNIFSQYYLVLYTLIFTLIPC